MKSQRELADGIKSLFQTVARTVGAARFIERELEPAVRNVSRAMDRLEEMADETERQLVRTLRRSGVTESMETGRIPLSKLGVEPKNDQRRVR